MSYIRRGVVLQLVRTWENDSVVAMAYGRTAPMFMSPPVTLGRDIFASSTHSVDSRNTSLESIPYSYLGVYVAEVNAWRTSTRHRCRRGRDDALSHPVETGIAPRRCNRMDTIMGKRTANRTQNRDRKEQAGTREGGTQANWSVVLN